MAERQGKIVWHEILTNDVKKVTDFYSKLLGWTVTEFPGAEPYYVLNNKGVGVAGAMTPPGKEKISPHWLLYLYAENADETVAKAKSLGAKVWVPPTDIPNVGRFAVMADPQGATFSVLQPSRSEYEPEKEAQVGEFGWEELMTSDWKAALKFYSALFGWEAREAHDMGPVGTYQLWSRPGVKFDLGGMFNRDPDMPPPAWVSYIRVPSVDDAAREIPKLGGKVMREPMDVPGGSRIVIGSDPTGAMFALLQSP
jgi:uncharacterized protein